MQRLRREYASNVAGVAGFQEMADAAALPQRHRGANALGQLPADFEQIEIKATYRLAEFLRFHDEHFIRNAYRGVLRREPDAKGSKAYLDALRAASLSKAEIIGRLRFSTEGRAIGIRVRELLPALVLRTLRRIPIAGRVLGIAQHVLRLPELVRNHERLEAEVAFRNIESGRRINEVENANHLVDKEVAKRLQEVRFGLEQKASSEHLTLLANALLDRLEHKLNRAEFLEFVPRLSEQLGSYQVALDQFAAASSSNDKRLANAEASLAGLALEGMARDAQVGKLDAMLHQLREEFTREIRSLNAAVPPSFGERSASTASQNSVELFAGIYASLEDRFRGSRNEVRLRASEYLALVVESGAGSGNGPILDLGCGRGEWLQLLQEHRLVARGVEINRIMLDTCRDLGLEVLQSDALEHIRQAPDCTFGAITALHLIEHLPFDHLISLIAEMRRTLKPGGLAILETPNPENMIVGACTFYADPTHQRPLPPELMRFVGEKLGFAHVEIRRLHPYPDELHLKEGHPTLVRWINQTFYGPRDYALVMRK